MTSPDPFGWHEGYERYLQWREARNKPSSDSRYVCPTCKRELLLAYCKKVEHVHVTDPKTKAREVFVRVVFVCPCVGWARAARYPLDRDCLVRLFGGAVPALPWPRTWGRDSEGYVDSPPQAKVATIDEQVARWAWDLEAAITAHDFLLFCRGPREA